MGVVASKATGKEEKESDGVRRAFVEILYKGERRKGK